MTHCLEVKQRWARQRLVPTTFCSILSLAHFHLVMWFYPASYPLPTMVPNIVESLLLLVTTTTCALNALTQLLLNGAITNPMFGHTASLMPKWDEDFSVVLFRLGTASLEATNVAGYGNEVGSIARPASVVSASQQTAHGMVELSPAGVVSVVYEQGAPGNAQRGFANEIKTVKASSRNSEAWADNLLNIVWHREMWRFMLQLWRFLSGWTRYSWRRLLGRKPTVPDTGHVHHAPEPAAQSEHISEPELYERFLRGEDLSEEDDEDDEFEPPTEPGLSREGTPFSPDDESASDSDDAAEAVQLYADLSQSAATSAAAPLLLAHMTDAGAAPLTRRRYSRLVHLSEAEVSAADDFDAFVQERREAKHGFVREDYTAESRQACVICTAEPREIVCWPCRCVVCGMHFPAHN